jgi:hypothetical protein
MVSWDVQLTIAKAHLLRVGKRANEPPVEGGLRGFGAPASVRKHFIDVRIGELRLLG